jgi:hypothetical protein
LYRFYLLGTKQLDKTFGTDELNIILTWLSFIKKPRHSLHSSKRKQDEEYSKKGNNRLELPSPSPELAPVITTTLPRNALTAFVNLRHRLIPNHSPTSAKAANTTPPATPFIIY